VELGPSDRIRELRYPLRANTLIHHSLPIGSPSHTLEAQCKHTPKESKQDAPNNPSCHAHRPRARPSALGSIPETVPCKPEPESRGHNSPHNLNDESAVRCLREFIQVQENWLIVLALGLDGAKCLIRGHEAVITHRFDRKKSYANSSFIASELNRYSMHNHSSIHIRPSNQATSSPSSDQT
jgi:hypothetical protein